MFGVWPTCRVAKMTAPAYSLRLLCGWAFSLAGPSFLTFVFLALFVWCPPRQQRPSCFSFSFSFVGKGGGEFISVPRARGRVRVRDGGKGDRHIKREKETARAAAAAVIVVGVVPLCFVLCFFDFFDFLSLLEDFF